MSAGPEVRNRPLRRNHCPRLDDVFGAADPNRRGRIVGRIGDDDNLLVGGGDLELKSSPSHGIGHGLPFRWQRRIDREVTVGHTEAAESLNGQLVGAAARRCVDPSNERATHDGVLGVEEIDCGGGAEMTKRLVEPPDAHGDHAVSGVAER